MKDFIFKTVFCPPDDNGNHDDDSGAGVWLSCPECTDCCAEVENTEGRQEGESEGETQPGGMFIIYFTGKESIMWRCGERRMRRGEHRGEKEGADTLDRTQKHSVTLSGPHKYTHTRMPVFWQVPKGPAASIHTPSHLILFMLSPTLNTFPAFSSAWHGGFVVFYSSLHLNHRYVYT